MRKSYFCSQVCRYFLLPLFSFLIIFTAFSQQQVESITISTYYPAPYGVYLNLRLFPSVQPELPCQEGTMYYDSAANQVMVCVEDPAGHFTWQGAGLWSRNGNDVFLPETAWNVGIGTTTPKAKLDVNGEVKIGMSAPELGCSADTGGAMRYNNGKMEYCDSSVAPPIWKPMGGKPTISEQFTSTITTLQGENDVIFAANSSDWDACYLEASKVQIDDETVVDEADDEFRCTISQDAAGWHLKSYFDRHTTHNLIEQNKGTVTCKARCLKW